MSDDLERVERALAQRIAGPTNEGFIDRRQGVIDAVNANGTVDVMVGGVIVPGVRYKQWYSPRVNDAVFVDVVGTDLVVDGPLATTRIEELSAATVDNSASTTSTSFDDLPGSNGPAVEIRTATVAVVTLTAQMSSSGGLPIMSVLVSGPSSVDASDSSALVGPGGTLQASRVVRLTGLTPGNNTFTARYRTTAGTGTFERRSLMVEPLR